VTRHHRLLAPCLVALLVAGAAAAQELQKLAGTTPAQRAGVLTELMKTRLGLSEAQTPKVAAINLKYAEQMQPVLDGTDGPLMKLGEARRIDQAKEADLKGVLAPEQFEKYLAAKQEIREKMEQKMMERRAGGSATP
jgi:hypothetical protein